jgi:hypothetical protein
LGTKELICLFWMSIYEDYNQDAARNRHSR